MLVPAELSRVNDISSTDACITPNRPAYYENPIETWMKGAKLVDKYGEMECRHITEWAKAKAPLDPRTDAPLPDWAVDVLRLGRIGYKGRVRILMQHGEDILRYKITTHKGEVK